MSSELPDLPPIEAITDSVEPVKQKKLILEEYEPIRMTTEKLVPDLIPIISIGGSIVATAGNISMISGEAKSGKTALLSSLIAGGIATGPYDGFENINVRLNDKKLPVLHFETENSEPRHKTNHIATIKRAGLHKTPDHLLSYNIRQKPFKQYKNIVEKVCAGAVEKFGGIFMIVVDGAADFISSVNEEAEANETIKWMEELAIKYSVPVIMVVHTNPGSEKERGHLGSQGQRKAESVLYIKREGDISTIEPKMLRNAGAGNTPIIQFTYDRDKGYHVSCGVKEKLTQVNKQANKNMERFAELPKIATAVFGQKALGYGEAWAAIMKVTKLAETKSKNLFTELKVHDMILQGKEDKLWRLNLDQV